MGRNCLPERSFVAVLVAALLLMAAMSTSAAAQQEAIEGEPSSLEPSDVDGDTDYIGSLIIVERGPNEVGAARLPIAYLSFDDGPSSATSGTASVLGILDRYRIQATFFVVGVQVLANPGLFSAIAQRGHAIGNHTFDHPVMTQLGQSAQLSQFDRTQAAVSALGGPAMMCYRPPYGATNTALQATASLRGMVEVLWSIDSRDSQGGDTSTVIYELSRVADGSIALLHDGPANRPYTMAGLDAWLASNHTRFEFRALPQCGGGLPKPTGSPSGIVTYVANRLTTGSADYWCQLSDQSAPIDVYSGAFTAPLVDGFARREGNTFSVTSSFCVDPQTFSFGKASDTILVGDWDCDGIDTFGVRRGKSIYLANSNAGGPADVVFSYGKASDTIVVGDWDGDGCDTLAARRGNVYHVRNRLTGGPAETIFGYGRSDDDIFVGDWNGDGRDTIGVRRGGAYFFRNDLQTGPAQAIVNFGRSDDTTLIGDWNGDGIDTLAVVRDEG